MPRRTDEEPERIHAHGYWGRQGAGILFATGRRILLCLRSAYVLQPGTWGIPGGAVKPSLEGRKDAVALTVREEAGEELGGLPRGWRRVGETLFEDRGFRYTTVIARVSEAEADRFEPILNWESDEARWFEESELAEIDLHFGVAWTLGQARELIFTKGRNGRGGSRASRQKVSLASLLSSHRSS